MTKLNVANDLVLNISQKTDLWTVFIFKNSIYKQ